MGMLSSGSDSDTRFHHVVCEVLKDGVSNGLLALDNGLYSVNSENSQPLPCDGGCGVSESAFWNTNDSDVPHGINHMFERNEKEWPPSSAKYFIRKHSKKGDGKKGLVYNALIDHKRNTGFDGLTDDEMHYHLHVASIHH